MSESDAKPINRHAAIDLSMKTAHYPQFSAAALLNCIDIAAFDSPPHPTAHFTSSTLKLDILHEAENGFPKQSVYLIFAVGIIIV
jgi:hypothetical protein